MEKGQAADKGRVQRLGYHSCAGKGAGHKVRASQCILAVGLLSLVASTTGAQSGVVRPTSRAGATIGAIPAVSLTNAVIGTVRDPAGNPVANAPLQLRSLRNGTVDRAATADAEGAFAFRAVEPGTYVVEMVVAGGVVAAVSEATTVGVSEVVQTLVQLTVRTRTFGWWLGSTADSAVAQAASSGVLAVDPGVPASPERPPR